MPNRLAHPSLYWRTLFALVMLLASLHAPAAERRVALIIGNASYGGEAQLSNPINDARLVASTLRGLGFELIGPKGKGPDALYTDLDKEGLQQAFIDFGKRAKNADVVFVYYSGHGLRGSNGRNYLVPVRSVIESDDHIRLRSVQVDDLLDELGSADQQLRIVVLDACRNNPFGDRKKGYGEKGLARPSGVTSGTLMAFATGDGQTALDGKGSTSPYAEALATRLQEPVQIKEVFDRVARDVYEKTAKRQRPSKVDDVLGEYFLAGKPVQVASVRAEPVPPAPATRVASEQEVEQDYWTAIKESRDVQDFKDYLQRYPKGRFEALAQRQVRVLAPVTSGAANVQTNSTLQNALPTTVDPLLRRLDDQVAAIPINAQCDIVKTDTVRADQVYVWDDRFNTHSTQISVLNVANRIGYGKEMLSGLDAPAVVLWDIATDAKDRVYVRTEKGSRVVGRPKTRSKTGDFSIHWTVKYNVEGNPKAFTHTACTNYIITSCGDGVVDASDGEQCDGLIGVKSGEQCTNQCRIQPLK
jgi:hypothetical protein